MCMHNLLREVWVVGSWIDPWTVAHICIGTALAACACHFGLPFWVCCAMLITVAVSWEILELVVLGWHETVQNRLVDVVVTLAGGVPVFLFVSTTHLLLVVFTSILLWALIIGVVWLFALRSACYAV